MRRYRVAVPVSLMFDVKADDDDEALAAARAVLEAWLDGDDGADVPGLEYGRLYPALHGPDEEVDVSQATVEDVTEDFDPDE